MFIFKKKFEESMSNISTEINSLIEEKKSLENQVLSQSILLKQLIEKQESSETSIYRIDKQQQLVCDKYSDEIKEAVKNRIRDEVYSTSIEGNLVRYDSDLNELFPIAKTKKILVTATMSAGKSAVINALIGKEILKSRNTATTGKTYHILNKNTQNKNSSRYEKEIERELPDDILEQYPESNCENSIFIGTVFNNETLEGIPLEFIDTPGINYSENPNHKSISEYEIDSNDYDMILYVINATQNGVSDDHEHLSKLQGINKPIIFILNKLDEFNEKRDSLEETYKGTVDYLKEIGFEYPDVIPLSAYAGLLSKKIMVGTELTEFELDDFELFYKKFKGKTPYNLNFLNYEITQEGKAKHVLINSGLDRLGKKIFQTLYSEGLNK
ncbi:dynamin family protein [Vagococcus fessus]|uniref:dynamin family protein n=1 Tax=Vagococcus fessus TaxID=120370 RepID=UPI00147397F5|nr:dynamin family protein [Vagococcus fessus]